MIPPLERVVDRPVLTHQLVAALTDSATRQVGLSTGLVGVGGFGKSTLAAWVCSRPEVLERFPGGLLWVNLGQDIGGVDLAEKINDLVYALSGRRPPYSDPDTAGAELGRLLDESLPALIIIDDAWDEAQIRPFRFGGRTSTRLITTRIPRLLGPKGIQIRVDRMTSEEAHKLLADDVDGLSSDSLQMLADMAGRWPVLLNLINGVLRRWSQAGRRIDDAAADVARRLAVQGPTAFDPSHVEHRSQAVAATIEAGLSMLPPAMKEHYFELAIFPEDTEIPLEVLELIWPSNRAERFCEELSDLGLVTDYRLDDSGPRLVLHDIVRMYLREQVSPEQLVAINRRLVHAAAGLISEGLPGEAAASRPWWHLATSSSYLWRFLVYHLIEAHQTDEASELACDLRWVEAKAWRTGSVVGAISDLHLIRGTTATTLREALVKAASLVVPMEPTQALGATLASRLVGIEELDTVVTNYRRSLRPPLLEPAWRFPDVFIPGDPASDAVHHGGVVDCAISPDETRLATASTDGTCRVWNLSTGSQELELAGHSGGVWACAFSPDGTRIATASNDRTVRIWSAAEGSLWQVLTGHTGWVRGCVFSPDGSTLATVGHDATIRIWSAETWEQIGVFDGRVGEIGGCDFSPDGRLLAIAGQDGTARIIAVSDGSETAAMRGHTGRVTGCTFSPDGRTVASTSYDRSVRIWDSSDGSPRAVLEGHSDWVWCASFSPDGKFLMSGSADTTARIWSLPDGGSPIVLSGHAGGVWGCDFSSSGNVFATASMDGTARLWSDDAFESIVSIGRANQMWDCAFSPDGAVLAGSGADGSPVVWRGLDASSAKPLVGHSARVRSCEFSPDSEFLATVSDDRTARLWLASSGTVTRTFLHDDGVRGCSFSPDGILLATASNDGLANIWDAGSGERIRTIAGHSGAMTRCAFSPEGELLATTGADATAKLWNVHDGRLVADLVGHTDGLNNCAFSPDGETLVTTSDDHTARLWKVSDGSPVGTLTHPSWAEGCHFSPDGSLLATACHDHTLRIWSLDDLRCVSAIRLGCPPVKIAWHPSGSHLCAVGVSGTYLLRYSGEGAPGS